MERKRTVRDIRLGWPWEDVFAAEEEDKVASRKVYKTRYCTCPTRRSCLYLQQRLKLDRKGASEPSVRRDTSRTAGWAYPETIVSRHLTAQQGTALERIVRASSTEKNAKSSCCRLALSALRGRGFISDQSAQVLSAE